ncbi:hypothetical protein GF342_02025 [Candidatus Woesearchaeota archaeon]|nr:hypothetical protein [Candidatus Woesearchaeota archaeon]
MTRLTTAIGAAAIAAIASTGPAKAEESTLSLTPDFLYKSNGNGDDYHQERLLLSEEKFSFRIGHERTGALSRALGGAQVCFDLGPSHTRANVYAARTDKHDASIGASFETRLCREDDDILIVGSSLEWQGGQDTHTQLTDLYVGTDIQDLFLRAGISRLGDTEIARGVIGYSLDNCFFAGIGGRYEGIPKADDRIALNALATLFVGDLGIRAIGDTSFDRNAGIHLLVAYKPTFGMAHGPAVLNTTDAGLNEIRLIPDITNCIIPYDFERGKAVLAMNWRREQDAHTLDAGAYYTFDWPAELQLTAGLQYHRRWDERNRDSLTISGAVRGYGLFLYGNTTVQDGDKPAFSCYVAYDIATLLGKTENSE